MRTASGRKLVNRTEAFGYMVLFLIFLGIIKGYYGMDTPKEYILAAIFGYGALFMGFKTIFPDR